MSTNENQQTVDRFMVAISSDGDLDVLDAICAPDVAAEWRHNMENFSFSEFTIRADQAVADGDSVALLWHNSGRHTQPYAGIPATGLRTTGHGSAFFTFRDGLVVQVVSHFDAEDLFRQLGATVRP